MIHKWHLVNIPLKFSLISRSSPPLLFLYHLYVNFHIFTGVKRLPIASYREAFNVWLLLFSAKTDQLVQALVSSTNPL